VPTTHLTARNVRSLLPHGDRRTDYWDDTLPGFCLRVSPSGARTYAVWYRVHGEARRYTIGRLETIDLATARQKAREVLADAKLHGKDANEERNEARKRAALGDDFEALANLFLQRHGPNLRPRTLAEFRRTLEVDVFPVLGDRRPVEIQRGQVRSLIVRIAERAPTQANRTFAVVRRVFSWAVGEDLLQVSPCVGLKTPTPERPRDRVYSTDEIRAIWTAVSGTELELFVPFVFYTGARSEEARSAKWSDVDLHSRLWTIPGERSKNAESHPLPLSVGALRVLRRLPKAEGVYLFPAPTREGFMDHPQKTIVQVRERSAVADFRLHDVRRTVATRLSQMGTLDAVVEAVLGHTPPKLKRTYNRYQPIKEMRVALDAWSAALDRIVGSKPGRTAQASRDLQA
jgi:integrase